MAFALGNTNKSFHRKSPFGRRLRNLFHRDTGNQTPQPLTRHEGAPVAGRNDFSDAGRGDIVSLMARPLKVVEGLLICQRCWADLFNTFDYEMVCMRYSDSSKDTATYNVSRSYLHTSAKQGCSWCKLIEVALHKFSPEYGPGELKIMLSDGRYWPRPRPDTGSNSFQLAINRPTNAIGLIAFTPPANRAAGYVTARPMRANLCMDAINDDIQSWMADCAAHDCCVQSTETSLPTRVIELNPSEDPEQVRLVVPGDRKGRYAALSYCWGASSSHILTSATLSQYLDRISWSILPQTIKDAVLVARAADMQYLWVDALCILQNDEDDKVHEIAVMCDIYRKSCVTIVAANADDASKGFLGQRKFQGETFNVPFCVGPGRFGTVSLQFAEDHDQGKSLDPIQRRAWTLQEHILAQRVLYFGSRTLEWRCAAGKRILEPDSIDLKPWYKRRVETEDYLLSAMLSPLPQSKTEALELWEQLVANYSPRVTTLESDRLRALAGMAQVFSGTLGPNYYAGLWQFDLARQLNWYRRRGTQISRSKTYCAPSWSWAASPGTFVRPPVGTTIEIQRVTCTPASLDLPYGAVTDGAITVCGLCAYGQLSRYERDPEQWTIVLQNGVPPYLYGDVLYENRTVKPVEVILDAVEETQPKFVLCLQTCTYEAGLVLESVSPQRHYFRRVGYYILTAVHHMNAFWKGELTIV